jgi:hypothetical protein
MPVRLHQLQEEAEVVVFDVAMDQNVFRSCISSSFCNTSSRSPSISVHWEPPSCGEPATLTRRRPLTLA